MAHTLDAEVVQALDRAGHRARAFQDVTTIRFPSFRRATYRIDLDSGETIKARCLEDEASAQQLFEIRRGLPSAFVPAFFQHGRVLLERWIPGTVLGTTPPERAHLVEAGALLATLHATRDVGEPDDGTGTWRARTERGLRALVESGALETRDADRLERDMAAADPGRAVAGLGHFDFCGENMVIDYSGRMHVFDNERVGRGALGFDLARAWYRWRLPERSVGPVLGGVHRREWNG